MDTNLAPKLVGVWKMLSWRGNCWEEGWCWAGAPGRHWKWLLLFLLSNWQGPLCYREEKELEQHRSSVLSWRTKGVGESACGVRYVASYSWIFLPLGWSSACECTSPSAAQRARGQSGGSAANAGLSLLGWLCWNGLQRAYVSHSFSRAVPEVSARSSSSVSSHCKQKGLKYREETSTHGTEGTSMTCTITADGYCDGADSRAVLLLGIMSVILDRPENE